MVLRAYPPLKVAHDGSQDADLKTDDAPKWRENEAGIMVMRFNMLIMDRLSESGLALDSLDKLAFVEIET